jgi:hypothetical protein
MCRKGGYGASGYGSGILNGLIAKGVKTGLLIAALGEDVNPMELEYK